MGHLVAPEPVLVVGRERVYHNGHRQGQDENSHNGADAPNGLACDAGWGLGAITNWEQREKEKISV